MAPINPLRNVPPVDHQTGQWSEHGKILIQKLTDQVTSSSSSITALQARPFTKSFTSSQQTYSNGGQLTIAHGLGVAPVLVQLRAVCQTIDDGYAVNDEVILSENFIAPRVDSTNVQLSISSGGIFVVPKGGGASAAITVANWKLVVRAWA